MTVPSFGPSAAPRVATVPPIIAGAERPFVRFARDYFDSRFAVAALALLLVLVALASVAPWIVPQNPYDLAQVDVMESRLPPGTKSPLGYTYWPRLG